jgi:hypothetical protein
MKQMAALPVYVKTDPHMPRPADPEFYLVTRSGTFICRNHAFFTSDVRTTRGPSALEFHGESCSVRYPKLSRAALEFAVGFFDRVYDLHRSEAVVLLFWDLRRKRYKLWIPEQQPTVWESFSGRRSATDVAYQVPVALPKTHLLVGDIHSHADLSAYASQQDRADEFYRDGVHVVVGHIDEEPPQFHLDIAVDSQRFRLKFNQFLQGYRCRRRIIPQAWMNQVKVKVNRPWWLSTTTQSSWAAPAMRSDPQSYNSGTNHGVGNVKPVVNESSPIGRGNNRKKNQSNYGFRSE